MDSSEEGDVKIVPYPIFDLAEPNMRVLILGQSGAGKSVAMYLVVAAATGTERRVKRVIGFSSSEDANGVLGGMPGKDGIMPKLFVHPGEFKASKAEEFMNMQKQCLKKGKIKDGMIILDDILHKIHGSDLNTMRDILMVGRQYYTGLVAIGHGVKQLKDPGIRESFQVIISFNLKGEAKNLYECFFKGVFDKFADFEACAKEIWSVPRRAIVIDTRQPQELSKCVFSFKVPEWLGRAWTNKDPITKELKPLLPLPKLGSANKWALSKRIIKVEDKSKVPDPFSTKKLQTELQILRGGGLIGGLSESDKKKKGKSAVNYVIG